MEKHITLLTQIHLLAKHYFASLNRTFFVLLRLETGNFKNFTPVYKSAYMYTSQMQTTNISAKQVVVVSVNNICCV